MADKVTEVFGIQGRGPTRGTARLNAMDKIERMVQRVDTGPRMFRIHGRLLFIWPDAEGWSYKLVGPDVFTDKSGYMYGSCSISYPLEIAIEQGVTHAAHAAWAYEVDNDREFAAEAVKQVGSSVPEKRHESIIANLVQYFFWQRDYRRLRELGATDAEAHEHAGRKDGWLPPSRRAA